MTSFHHQPEAQHPKSSAIHKDRPADYPIYWHKADIAFCVAHVAFDPKRTYVAQMRLPQQIVGTAGQLETSQPARRKPALRMMLRLVRLRASRYTKRR